MILLKRLCIIAAVGFIATSATMADHFYSYHNKINLLVDSSKCRLLLDSSVDEGVVLEQLSQWSEVIKVAEAFPVISGCVVLDIGYHKEYLQFLDSIRSLNGVRRVEPCYLWEDKAYAQFTGRICMSFSEKVSSTQAEHLFDSLGLEVINANRGLEGKILLGLKDGAGGTTIEIANVLAERADIKWSHPQTQMEMEKSSVYKVYDYYSRYSDHVKKICGTFNTASVWDFWGVTRAVDVAIFDDGFEDHEDLPPGKWLPGWDAADLDLDVTPVNTTAHGMACASLLAANHSLDTAAWNQRNSGVISIAPYAMLRPVKVFSTDSLDPGVTEDEISDGIDWAWLQGAEVMSNSWHFTYRTPFECIDQSYLDARTLGRDGKGCVVVFAAGNRGEAGVEYPSNLSNCIAVGATNLNDTILEFSAWDTMFTVDLVAPSDSTNARGHVWACDQMGNEGYNRQNGAGLVGIDDNDTAWNCPDGDDLDYNCAFGGTSAAAPLVAGVAALVLSKDSTLTAAEVESILYGSALRPLGMGTPPQVPHIKYGYGRVDAFRAVLSISHGDVNNNGTLDISDLSMLIAYLTLPPPQRPAIFPSKLLADWNCSGSVDLTDLAMMNCYFTTGCSAVPPVNPCFKF